MFKKDIFSIRKTKLGVGSLLLGSLFFLGSVNVNAETVTKEFNDIETTVEVIGENIEVGNLDLSSESNHNVYILTENDVDNNKYYDYLKVNPTEEEFKRGYEYIKSTYESRPENAKRLTSEEIEKNGGFQDGDLIITGTPSELKHSENINAHMSELNDWRLPYVYYPEKPIVWKTDGLSEITVDNFKDYNKLLLPTNVSVSHRNVESEVSFPALGYSKVGDKNEYTLRYSIGDKSYERVVTSEGTLSELIGREEYIDSDKNKLFVSRHFNIDDLNSVSYIGSKEVIIPNGDVYEYNVGMPSLMSDGRIGTRLSKIYFETDVFNSYVNTDVTDIAHRGWGDYLAASGPKYGANTLIESPSFKKWGGHAAYDTFPDIGSTRISNYSNVVTSGYSENIDNREPVKLGKITAVWRDGIEPRPLKVGESIVKEYKLIDSETKKELTDWLKITFVGDTRQYDSVDDVKELDVIELSRFLNTEYPTERHLGHMDADTYESDGTGNANRNLTVDGPSYRYYEGRNRQNFVTGEHNLKNYDGYSWDLVPSFSSSLIFPHTAYNNTSFRNSNPNSSGVAFRTVTHDVRPSTLNVFRVRKEENGSVVVAYENELGETIKNEETLIDNQPIGTQYTSEPTDTIVGTNGQTYYKVKLKDGSQPATGDVTKETKKVTWVYRLPEVTDVKGKVVVKYVDTEGRELLTEYATDEKVVSTIVNRFTADGGKQLVSSTPSNETYNVEGQKHPSITDQNIVYNFKEVKDSKPLTGTLTEGETVITLVYEQANVTKKVYGRIIYDIVNEYGDVLAKDVTLDDVLVETVVESPTGEVISRTKHNPQYDYTLPEDEADHFNVREFPPVKKPAKFDESIDYTKDRQYGNWDGPTPIMQPELFTMKEPYTGEIHEGDNHLTFVVTYPGYDGSLRRNVKVNFVNEKGETIKESVVTDYKEVAYIRGTIGEGTEMSLIRPYNKNEQYDVSSNAVDFEVNDKRYTYLNEKDNIALTGALGVSWDAYNADREYVDVNTVYKNFTVIRGDARGEHTPAHVDNIENHEFQQANMFVGYHAEDTLELTLVFREEKLPTETREELGHVKVVYTDETGREIDTAIVKAEEVVNRIVEQPMVDGTRTVVSTTPTNATYDVTADKKERIEFDGYEYTFKQVKDVQPTGTLAVGETVVTYVYEVVPKVETVEEKGTVKVRYEDTEGNVLKEDNVLVNDQLVNTRTKVSKSGADDEFTDAPTNIEYDASLPTIKLSTLEKDENTYNFVRQKGNESLTGKVPVGETVITYVYEVAPKENKGSVVVRFVTEDGVELKNDDVITNGTGEEYDTTTLADEYIETDGIRYKKVRVDGVERGNLSEDETVVTYVYKKWMPKVEETKQYGNVVVRYLEKGTEKELLTSKDAVENTLVNTHKKVTSPDDEVTESDVPTNATYDVTTYKYPFITSEEMKYNWVSEDTPVIGTLPTGELVITFYYELNSNGVANTTETGTVTVKFQDDLGNDLKSPVTLKDNVVVNNVKTETFKDGTEDVVTKEPTGAMYDASEVKESELEFEDFTYRVTDKIVGTEKGTVPTGVTEVIYVYEAVPKVEESFEKGSVTVHFRDKDGKDLIESKKIVDEVNVIKVTLTTTPKHGERVEDDLNVEYDATTVREDEIVIDGVTYKRIADRVDGVEKGKVAKGDNVVTYYYEEVKPESKPEPKPESKPEPKPESKPEPKPESMPEPKPESKPEPKPESKPEPKSESKVVESSAQQLPETGEEMLSLFIPATLSILAGLGLVVPSKKKD